MPHSQIAVKPTACPVAIYDLTGKMENSVDPDKQASSEVCQLYFHWKPKLYLRPEKIV